MPGVRKRGEEIREFILDNITDSKSFAVLTAERFSISLPAVYKHVDRLISEKKLIKKDGQFILQTLQYKYHYKIEKSISEDAVWVKDIKKHFSDTPHNILNIWLYGFLEIFNNAIDHSKGKTINVVFSKNRDFTSMQISDDGIGIFNNIKTSFNLMDEKDALLELAKGKRTTEKTRHSGQGIYFTSKIFDEFIIYSKGLTFNSVSEKNKQNLDILKFSTLVYMQLANNSNKILKDVFDEYSTKVPGDFDKTTIPVSLANSTDLVARSQARRLLNGLELFKEVTLDFTDVQYIGQGFADEVFRVFPNMNPDTRIKWQNANPETLYMINRAINTKL
ncbi:MAG: DUF4325 domain-containing protein [Treponema sp.]|nr:DUF4325 domain-containing protein [Treponema sp.]